MCHPTKFDLPLTLSGRNLGCGQQSGRVERTNNNDSRDMTRASACEQSHTVHSYLKMHSGNSPRRADQFGQLSQCTVLNVNIYTARSRQGWCPARGSVIPRPKELLSTTFQVHPCLFFSWVSPPGGTQTPGSRKEDTWVQRAHKVKVVAGRPLIDNLSIHHVQCCRNLGE